MINHVPIHRPAGAFALLILALALSPTLPSSARTQAARAFPPDSAVLAIIKQRVEEKRSAGIVVGLLEPGGRSNAIDMLTFVGANVNTERGRLGKALTFAHLERGSGHMGVVVLTNSGGAGADDIGMHLLDPDLALTPDPAPPKPHTAIELSAEPRIFS